MKLLGFRASSEHVAELGLNARQTCLPGHHSPVSGDEIGGVKPLFRQMPGNNTLYLLGHKQPQRLLLGG